MATIETITFEARVAFEEQKIPRHILAQLYLAYNPDIKDIGSFLTQANNLFPALNCGLTAVYLRHQIGEGEIVTGAYNNQSHTFIALGDLAIDITADQFGGPPVYVGDLAAPWNRERESIVKL